MITKSDQTFWKSFAKKNWERQPLIVKNFNSSVSKIDKNQIFDMLVNYSNVCRKNKTVTGFKLFVDGFRQHDDDVLQILPIKSDRTLEKYHLRMEKIFFDYCLVCDELLQTSQMQYELLNDFTNNLFWHVGFPNRFAEMGLYLGNYKKTPFGVHIDSCGVFSFPVIGHKKFRIWTSEYVEKNKKLNQAHDYSKYKKDSLLLKAEPSDMTYWPSSSWHIAESDGSFNATWSLGIWVDKTHQEAIIDSIKPFLKTKLGYQGQQSVLEKITQYKLQSNITNHNFEKLPSQYLNTIKKIKAITKNELYDLLIKDWIILKSKQGFKNSPQLNLKMTAKKDHNIQIPKSQKILFTKLKTEKKIIYVFQGQLIKVTFEIKFHQLILDLNARKIISTYYLQKSTVNQLNNLLSVNLLSA